MSEPLGSVVDRPCQKLAGKEDAHAGTSSSSSASSGMLRFPGWVTLLKASGTSGAASGVALGEHPRMLSDTVGKLKEFEVLLPSSIGASGSGADAMKPSSTLAALPLSGTRASGRQGLL
mmetsp:Transcript_109478/g.290823  ORF Transcript_109478/g.290823 Transcript_109478/m.290823 type:complete len:119 (+) Transcript_109478:1365-1721(+)